jgi:hypothetical protein
MLRGTLWEGVALRRIRTGADPDATPRAIALPSAWEDEAAAALAALAPGEAPISLPRMAEAWIGRALSRGRKAGMVGEAEAPQLAEGWRRTAADAARLPRRRILACRQQGGAALRPQSPGLPGARGRL